MVDGGAFLLSQSYAHFMNSSFQSSISNADGGVFNAQNSTVTVNNSTFVNNTANQKGGAVYATSASTFIVENCTFINSRAVNSSGGALYCTVISYCRIVQSAFELSRANDRGGAVYAKDSSSVVIQLSNFFSNMAKYGGALAARESSTFYTLDISGDYPSSQHSVQIHDSTAEYGGGIFLSDSAVYFGMRTEVSCNNATVSGGGIYADNSSISFIDSVEFVQNRAVDGGGISLLRSMLYDDPLTLNILNFMSNRATQLGGALFVNDDSYLNSCPNNQRSEDHTSKGGCFFQNITDNFTIEFVNNSANLSGSDLYGGLLDRCGVNDHTNFSRIELSGIQRFEKIANIMNFNTVTSNPVRVCLCNADMEPDLDQQMYYVQVKQRNSFVVPIVAVDHVNHMVPATIEARVSGISLSQSQRIQSIDCLLYTSPSPRDATLSRMPSSA